MSLNIDISQITNVIQQLLPVVIQIAVLGLVLSLVFNTLLPMITGAFK
ncbi:MAG: hypothetical protein QXV17_14590 [Candidatus Micrarchaeaceae archaeon]